MSTRIKYRLIRVVNCDGQAKRTQIWRGVGNDSLLELSFLFPKYWSRELAYDLLPACDNGSSDQAKVRTAVESGRATVSYVFEQQYPNQEYEVISDPRILVCCLPEKLLSQWSGPRPRCEHRLPARMVRHLVRYLGTELTSMDGFRMLNPGSACTV